MPAPKTPNELIELVHKSGLIDSAKLDAYLERLRTSHLLPREPTRLAEILIRDGVLTHFQAEQFLGGKWRNFVIGPYKVLERLGVGRMGAVYLCQHPADHRRVAIKVLPDRATYHATALRRFQRESRALVTLDHPNVVRGYGTDQVGERLHFLVMEFIDGVSLADLVEKKGPLDVSSVCHFVRQASLGLQHLFDYGLVHRDLKPADLLVDRCGVVTIIDLGLCSFVNDGEHDLELPFEAPMVDNIDFVAPEQALVNQVDIRADIYSLGAILYFCLTGQRPFPEGTASQKRIWSQTRTPQPIHAVRPEVPSEVVAIQERMMARDPGQRFQKPQEVAAALAPWTKTPVVPPAETDLPPLSPAARGLGSF